MCKVEDAIGVWLLSFEPATQNLYKVIFKQVKRVTGKPVAQLKTIDASNYLSWLKSAPGLASRIVGVEAKQANNSIILKMGKLRKLFDYLVMANLVKQNPIAPIWSQLPPSTPPTKRPTRAVDFEKVGEIISAPVQMRDRQMAAYFDRHGRYPDWPDYSLRDMAILALLFGGGLRRSEVCRLAVGNIGKTAEGADFITLVKQKNHSLDDHGIPAWAAAIVRRYIIEYRGTAKPNDPMFLHGQARIRGHDIYLMYREAAKSCGLGGYSPHTARATGITKLLKDGVPHRVVQAFSRHSSIQMVELYDKRSIGVNDSPALKLTFNVEGIRDVAETEVEAA